MNLFQKAGRRESDNGLPFLFRTSPLPMWIYDLESLAFLDVNETAVSLYGYTRDEFLAMTILQIRPAEEIAGLLRNISETRPGFSRSSPWKHRTKSGSLMDVEIVSNEIEFNGRRARLVVIHNITEHMHMVHALAESEARLRAIIDAEPECISVWSFDDRLLEINPSGLAMFEAESLAQVQAHSFQEFILPAYRPAFVEHLQRAKQGVSQSPVQYEITGLKGTTRWLETTTVCLRNAESETKALLGITRDITARMQSENSLHEGLKLQELLMRMATTFVNVPNDRIDETINGALATIGMFVGADRAYLFKYDFVADTMSNTHEWCAEGISKEIANSQNIPNALLDVIVSAHRRGDVLTLPRVSDLSADDPFRQILELQKVQSLILFPMIGGGELLGFVGFDAVREERKFTSNETVLLKVLAEILANAEVRRRGEEFLRESEEKFRAMVENSSDLIWEVNENGVYTYVSPQIRSILGYSAEEVIGKTPFDLMPPDEARRVGALFDSYVQGRKQINAMENINRHKDGRLVTMETNGVPIIDRNGVFHGYRGIDRDITERTHVLETLRQSDIKFRTVVQNAQAVVFILDRDGVFLLSDGLALANLGLKPGQVVGVSALEMYRDNQSIVDSIKQALSGEIAHVMTELNGLIFDTMYSPVFDNAGEVTAIVGIATDITERRRATEELQAKEERYRALFDVSPVGIMLLDSNGLILDINDSYTKSHQYHRDELIGKDVRTLVPHSEWGLVDTHIARILAGETLEHEVVNTRKDGSLCVIELRETAIRLPDGRRGVLSVANDISIRKNIEEALRSSEERYRRFFEEDLTAVAVSTPDGTIVDCNPAFVRMLGFPTYEEALLTKTQSLFMDGQQRQILLRRLTERGKLQENEVLLRRTDGTVLHTAATLIGSFDHRGKLTQILGYWHDKTLQKQLEEQLLQSQKMESLGTLASGIAHDFNNILGIVLGHASLLNDGSAKKEKVASHTSAILKATERGIGVVKQLLTFARKTDVHLEPVHVNDIVHELTKLLHETFPKNIVIASNFAGQLPTVIADVNQMHQIVLNLCVNARDAMLSGGTLTVSTSTISLAELQQRWPEASAETYVVLAVADTGTGIDEATRSRIFEPFFTTKAHGKGTGLGLATVYGIVQTHKGWVDVQSEVGKGTVFSIYLPVRPRAIDTSAQTEHRNELLPGGNETILFVEDEPMLQEMVTELLTSKGYTVISATNGALGLESYKQHADSISLVVSDLGLPVVEGDELFVALKSLNPSVKFILASGFVDPQIKAQLTAQGLDHMIGKPYYPSVMLRKIREVLDA